MTILRRIFPMKTECPSCKSLDWKAAGTTRSGDLQCRRCRACGHRYRVGAIAEERDDGGAWSRVVPLS